MKINLLNIRFNCIFLLLIFLMCLDGLSSIGILQFMFRHVDELIVIIFLMYVFINISFLQKRKGKLLLAWGIFITLGLVSSIAFGYQDIYAAFIDGVLIINKFVIGYFTAYIYVLCGKRTISERVYKAAKFITVILFLLAVHDFILPPFFEKADFRYFVYSIKLMFPHATYLAATGITLLIYFGYKNYKNSNFVYMFMSGFLAMATLRGKAVGFVLVYWLIYLFVYVFKARHYLFTIASGGIAALLIGMNQIQGYFFTKAYSPRLILLKDSISLAIKHFPFGTGYGTFGSSMAAEHYSVLYTQLGYEDYWGMGSKSNMFLTDGFWPVIIAQFGFLGLMVFVFVVCYFFKQSIRIIKINKNAGFAMLLIMIDMMINSLAETAFFNPTALMLFVLFGVCEAEAELKKGTKGY